MLGYENPYLSAIEAACTAVKNLRSMRKDVVGWFDENDDFIEMYSQMTNDGWTLEDARVRCRMRENLRQNK